MKNVVFITGNKNKLREATEILGDGYRIINFNFDLQEIQSIDVKEVIHEKIKEADKIFRTPEVFSKIKEEFSKIGVTVSDFKDIIVICEDTGFHIDSMNNDVPKTERFPGALIKFYLGSLGPKEIIKRDSGSTARLSCYIGIISNGQIREPVEAIVEGNVATEYHEGGFGFDPCFVPKMKKFKDYQGKSYAQLPSEIKNQVSHRSLAFNKLKKVLTRGGTRRNRQNKRSRTFRA
jgi:non-canonical purine NTP pyrophosphatase (RdgB/HAM1 family)